MGLNVTFLKDAIYSSITSDVTLMNALKASQVDSRTGKPRDVVFESEPNFVGVVPAITFTILDVEPVVESDPTIGVYRSPVILFAVGSNQEESNYIGDLIQDFFVSVPTGEIPRLWFRDISTECLTNKTTRFLSRLRSGRQGISRNDYKADTVIDAVELEITWHPCDCDVVQGCDVILPTECDLDYDETYSQNNCP